MLIDAVRGHAVESGGVGNQQEQAEVEHGRTDSVFQEVARFFAMTWMLILSMTTDLNAHRRAAVESSDRPTRALFGVWDQRPRRSGQVKVRMRIAKVTAVRQIGDGRAGGSWWIGRVLVARSRGQEGLMQGEVTIRVSRCDCR